MTIVRLRPSIFWRAVIGAAVLGASLAHAAEPGLKTHAVGGWTLKLADGSRQCRLMLRADVMPPGYGIGMPVGCHLAFPLLAGVKMWAEVGEEKLQFEDGKGEPVLIFEPGTTGALSATGPEGENLRLDAIGSHRVTLLEEASKAERPGETLPHAVKPASVKPPLPTLAEMAGHYSVLRKLGKDTGCMVTLDDKTRGQNGGLKANLAPACRDQGIVIFDPVGWQLQAGQLVLIARKGHNTKLDLQADGSWMKDTKEGVSLALKKM